MGGSSFALPNDQDCPAEGLQFASPAYVSLNVLVELFLPKRCVGFRHPRHGAARMAVPVTPMDEYRLFFLREYDIGPTGKAPISYPVTIAFREERSPD